MTPLYLAAKKRCNSDEYGEEISEITDTLPGGHFLEDEEERSFLEGT
jgi:hypothetical protein